jgi:alpha-methylacyl-CoA racemase
VAASHLHHRARRSFIEVDGIEQPAPAPRFGRTPVEPPRSLDADGSDVVRTLTDWGITPGRARRWDTDGVVTRST